MFKFLYLLCIFSIYIFIGFYLFFKDLIPMIFFVCAGLKADKCLYSFEPRIILFESFAFAASAFCGNVVVSTDQLKFSKCEWNMILVTFVPFSSVALIRSEY